MSSTGPEVVIYHFGSTLLTPSPSLFALKLMTYVRMTGIKHKVIHSTKTSSKGKAPFITYNGQEVADSTFIMLFLNKVFGKDLNANLSLAEKAQALAFQRLCEENLYWTSVYQRWLDDYQGFSKQFMMGNIKRKMLKVYANVKIIPTQKANLHGHGMGRHSKEEIYAIAEKDIEALSNFLGKKSFLIGEEPTEVDCTLFGLIAQFAYAMPGSLQENLVSEKHPNLKAYADRIKEKYWPDWEECCAHDKEKNAPAEADAANTEEAKDNETNGKEEEMNTQADAAENAQNGKSENAEAESPEQKDGGAGDKADEKVKTEDATQATA